MRVSTVKCEVCQEAFGKYRCPRCKLVSCSLSCVKQHKEAQNCTGVRDRAAFVPLKDFDDLQLLSDYRLLEDLRRVVDAGNGSQKFKVLKRLRVLRKRNPRPQYQHQNQNQRQPRRRRKNRFHNKNVPCMVSSGNASKEFQEQWERRSHSFPPTLNPVGNLGVTLTNTSHCNPNLTNTIQENSCEMKKLVAPIEESKGESSTVHPSLKTDMRVHWDENEDVPPTEISLK